MSADDIRVHNLSVQYLWAPVRAENPVTQAGEDISGTAVKVAVVSSTASPASSDFVASTWETGGTRSIGGDAYYLARILVGPGTSHVLSTGTYFAYVQVTDSPETPVVMSTKAIIVY